MQFIQWWQTSFVALVPEPNRCHKEGETSTKVAREQVAQEFERTEDRLVDVDVACDSDDCIDAWQDRARGGDDGVDEKETGDVDVELKRFGYVGQRCQVCDGRDNEQDKVENS